MGIFFLVVISYSIAAEATLPQIYREAKAALEAGDATRCASLLEPALANVTGPEAAPAQLALGMAWLRLGKSDAAVPILQKAAAHFKKTENAANAFAPLGDALRAAGRSAKAAEAYGEAAAAAGNAPNIRYAKARVTELKGESAESTSQFIDAANAYLDAADALLALGAEGSAYLADARALYEKVAKGTGKPGKDWRGEPTARAVFGLGEVERVRGQWPEAIAYYQRVFVSWIKYPQWPARAYLRAAEGMDKLGKRDFAIRHLKELVRKVDKFGTLPEYQQAKAQLRAWGENIK